jgi:hypothetical protein
LKVKAGHIMAQNRPGGGLDITITLPGLPKKEDMTEKK